MKGRCRVSGGAGKELAIEECRWPDSDFYPAEWSVHSERERLRRDV